MGLIWPKDSLMLGWSGLKTPWCQGWISTKESFGQITPTPRSLLAKSYPWNKIRYLYYIGVWSGYTTYCTYVCPVFWCWKKKQIPLDSLFNADSEKLGVRAMHQPGENFSLEVKKSLLQPLFWLRKSLGDSNWRKFLNNKQRYKSIK